MIKFEDYFSIQIFFIILRETLETAIIISVLLSFINQRSHKQEEESTLSTNNNNNEMRMRMRMPFIQYLYLKVEKLI